MTELLVVMLWQVVLIGGWATSRRIRQLERNARPSFSEQLAAIEDHLLELRCDHAHDGDELARQLSNLSADVQRLVAHNESLSRALAERIARLERSLRIEPTAASHDEALSGWG